MPNNIIAFRVKHDSDFYRGYFDAVEECDKFAHYAAEFLNAHGINGDCYINERLYVKFDSEDEYEWWKDEVCVRPDGNGFYRFKKKSDISKEWDLQVVGQADMKLIHSNDTWWLASLRIGQYALWNDGDEIYGYLESADGCAPRITSYMVPISLDEYYAARDAADGLNI